MIAIRDVKFDDQMILNNGKFVLVELSPVFQEEVGSETKRLGTKAVVALTGHRLEKIEVLVEEAITCSAFNQLELAEITFSNFEGYFLPQVDGAHVFRAKASQLQLVRD